MTRYVATQHGKENIRCNAISPGLIVTPSTADTYANSEAGKIMLRHQLTPALRQARGHRRNGGVPRVGCGRLHHRAVHLDRRWIRLAHADLRGRARGRLEAQRVNTMTRSNSSDVAPDTDTRSLDTRRGPCARKWRRLFQPLQVRSLRVANRIVMSPMTREFSPKRRAGRRRRRLLSAPRRSRNRIADHRRRRHRPPGGARRRRPWRGGHAASLRRRGARGVAQRRRRGARGGWQDPAAAVAPGRHARAGHWPASRSAEHAAVGPVGTGRSSEFGRAGLRRARGCADRTR